jgi:ElaB/YqjD/DUF883 family membrane-anchored ribosome-binding protein
VSFIVGGLTAGYTVVRQSNLKRTLADRVSQAKRYAREANWQAFDEETASIYDAARPWSSAVTVAAVFILVGVVARGMH